MKQVNPVSMKSSGTDDPKKYVGGWETYDKPQGIKDRQDKKVLAKETALDFSHLKQIFEEFPINSMNMFVPDEGSLEDVNTDPGVDKKIKASRKPDMRQVTTSAKALSVPGKRPSLKSSSMMETIRIPVHGTLSNQYEIINEDEEVIGLAIVNKGVISELEYDATTSQTYRGQILSALLHQIVSEADVRSANLSIQINEMTSELKTLFERFGFRLVGGSVMKRNFGAIRPTSVPPAQGMTNRIDENKSSSS